MFRKRGNEKAGVNKMNNKQEGNRMQEKGQMMEKKRERATNKGKD